MNKKLVRCIQKAMEAHCIKLGCVPGILGGHHKWCRSFTYRIAISEAKDGTIEPERAERWSKDVNQPI